MGREGAVSVPRIQDRGRCRCSFAQQVKARSTFFAIHCMLVILLSPFPPPLFLSCATSVSLRWIAREGRRGVRFVVAGH